MTDNELRGKSSWTQKLAEQPLWLRLLLLVLLLAQWTTNDSNIYSSVLALNNIFKTKRWLVTIGAGLFASVLAAMGILERLELFLVFLTVCIGPIGGIFICDYYLLKRLKPSGLKEKDTPAVNQRALGVYLISVVIGWVTSGRPFTVNIFPFSIFAFNGILVSIILYYVIMKIFPTKEKTNGSKTSHRNL